ncbi:Uu.00g075190.m01.CDS01 [Anthostomella pinea]|uniref:Uu.00g075190.m01.CDS01 n=1 Tax=Anthostomella pinea TaxID=933095 RepID=A0AAI8VWC6_9PEZI|nr:Uu.00g075190.m01.CDS01 [Anthostomella pinea]
MYRSSLLGFAALASAAPQGGFDSTLTMLRFGCAQVVIDRLDPLVNPGVIPSPHVHQIVGGNGFNASMTTGDVSATASCTTCAFSEDFSNYWTANMYFKARNGTYKRVPQLGAAYVLRLFLSGPRVLWVYSSATANTPLLYRLQFGDNFSTEISGGVLVYYVSAQPGEITAFQPGFRMLVGDPTKRTADTNLKLQNCYRCYTGPNFGGDVNAPCQDDSIDTQGLPNKQCAGGIRSNLLFPTCWDGKNLDSPNHQAHVAYPTTGPAAFLSLGGACSSTHPVRIPQLMYEVVWDTTQFNDESIWPADGSQPFYLSYGDNTGYGQHGDYVFGWKDDALQKAMDTSGCMGATCSTLKNQVIADAKQCSVKTVVQEDHEGWLTELPGADTAMPM